MKLDKSKREKILDFFASNLQNNIGELKSIDVDRISAVNLSKHPTPSAFIYAGGETRNTSSTNSAIKSENWLLPVLVEVWLKPSSSITLEGLLTKIHWAMGLDPSLGGIAVRTWRVDASEPYIVDPENSIVGRTITFEVEYRHAWFDMTKD